MIKEESSINETTEMYATWPHKRKYLLQNVERCIGERKSAMCKGEGDSALAI